MAILLSGNILGQLVPILTSIILTRIYHREDFAVMAYFFTIAGTISAIAGGRYEVASMLPKNLREAKTLYALSILFTLGTALITTGVFIIWGDALAAKFNALDLSDYLLLIPLSILLVGLYQASNYYNNRLQNYTLMSKTTITRSLGTSASNISLGLAGFKPSGLIIGSLIGQFIGTVMLSLKPIRELIKELPTAAELKAAAIKYKNFPIQNASSMLLFILGNQLPILLIGLWFKNNAIVGSYALVLRVMNLPLVTLGKSLSQVYFQESTQSSAVNLQKLFVQTSKYLFLLILVPAILVIAFGPWLFSFIFGNEWHEAGVLAQVFMLFFMVRFIFASQNSLLISKEKLKTDFMFNLIFCISQVGAVIIGYYYKDVMLAFYLMAIAGFIQFGLLGLILRSSIKSDLYIN